MSVEKHAAHTNPEYFPENVEFLGFIGGCDGYVGVDTIHMLFYLIRTKDLDWLEAVVKYSNDVMSRKCVMSIPRDRSKREAAARLLNAYVRARVHYECPVPPYQPGLLAGVELRRIVESIANEVVRNREAAEEKQRRHEALIIRLARELGLKPCPAGHNDSAWMADCPRGTHWIMISPSHNEFGCGYCRRKGGPEELRAFYDSVRGQPVLPAR